MKHRKMMKLFILLKTNFVILILSKIFILGFILLFLIEIIFFIITMNDFHIDELKIKVIK